MNIVAWGDSITYGEGDSEGLGWIGRIRNELFNDGNHRVYNRGICGDTTVDVLDRFDVEAKSLEPESILLALGMNDCKFPNGGSENKVSLKDFKHNMMELISKARLHTQKIVIVGISDVKSEDIGSTSLFTKEAIAIFDRVLQEIAVHENLLYVPMRDVLNIDTDLSDGLHPNTQGYEKMYQTIRRSPYLGSA